MIGSTYADPITALRMTGPAAPRTYPFPRGSRHRHDWYRLSYATDATSAGESWRCGCGETTHLFVAWRAR